MGIVNPRKGECTYKVEKMVQTWSWISSVIRML